MTKTKNLGIGLFFGPTQSPGSFERLNSPGGRLLLDANQLHDAAGNIPVLDIEIAILVPGRAVGAAENSLNPILLGDVVVSALGGIGVVAKNRHDGVVLVEDDKATLEIGNGNIIALNHRGGGHSQTGDHLAEEFAFEAIVDQATFGLVIAIANQQTIGGVAGVQGHAVGGVEFLEAVAFGSKVAQVFAVLVELEDVVGRIAVGQIDVAIGGHGDRRGAELAHFEAGFLGEGELQDDVAGLGVELDPFGVGVAGAVDEFAFFFVPDFHVVDVGILFAKETANHFAIGRENENTGRGAGVDVSFLVDDDAAVGGSDDRFAIRPKAPAGDCVKGHDSRAHADGFLGFLGIGGKGQAKSESQSKPGKSILHWEDSWEGCRRYRITNRPVTKRRSTKGWKANCYYPVKRLVFQLATARTPIPGGILAPKRK